MISTPSNYSAIARLLHWVIAILIGGQLIGGFVLGHELVEGETLYQFAQLHKSFGLLVLLLSVLRLVWRFVNPPPPLPQDMKRWEVIISKLTHILFYVLMIAVPLAGWAYVSASPLQIPTKMFGFLPVPHLPLPVNDALAERLSGLHEFFAFATMGLLVLHVGAALKHSVTAGDKVMRRMAGRGIGPILAFALAALVAGGLIWVFAQPYDEHEELASTSPKDTVQTLADIPASTPATASAEDAAYAWDIVPESVLISVEVHAKQAKRHAYLDVAKGTIILDPDNPEAHGRIDVVVDTHSLRSDENMVKKLASESSWMDIGRFPEARFVSDQITRLEDGSYRAVGPLTLRDVSIELALPFTLEPTDQGVKANGEMTFDRADFGIGASDTDDTVVTLSIELEATRSGS